MKKDPIMIYEDFCVVRENGKYWYESDDEEYEVVLLAREPYEPEAESEDLIPLYNADVNGEEDLSGDYLYFVEARTFTFRTENALKAALPLEHLDKRGHIHHFNDESSKYQDLIIIDALPNEMELKEIMEALDCLDDGEMDEYPGDFFEAIQEGYKYNN